MVAFVGECRSEAFFCALVVDKGKIVHTLDMRKYTLLNAVSLFDIGTGDSDA